ncbi:tRNA-splicing ligase RtcB [Ordospora pajunii]|uniref:tRNA-splicing ligase RtcB n=1 Tax=Ordospora pajunii TaxID=3039483 RepID=UPI0029527A35|nr:tRNA-splicing ligase RtcB [Ordospora pajunii]KAH9412208.1 tRNA-splicing ligase RtcB [Ordospora pajunii]
MDSNPINIQQSELSIAIDSAFDSRMKTGATIYVDEKLRIPLFDELARGDELSSIKQLARICSLPGLVGNVVGLPDIHTGYGFPIGSVAAFDINNPESVVSPGGVGYDINCGVRALRANIDLKEFSEHAEKLADELFDALPTGIGGDKRSCIGLCELNSILDNGLGHLLRSKIISDEDVEYCESNGHMPGSSALVCQKAKGRGINQFGSLGSGNHYLEVQYVDEVYDEGKAELLGLRKNQIVVMIHSGSRGVGHGVCHDALMKMAARHGVADPMMCSQYESKEAQDYLAAMGSAANFAFANRASITEKARKAFERVFPKARLELVYDVCHNIAKEEAHFVEGKEFDVLVHRKGASRAFPPYHRDIPWKYREIGQPVMVGGSMGTFSYILCGAEKAMQLSFGSTCHGAGRLLARNTSKKAFTYEDVCSALRMQNIVFRCPNRAGMAEEAPDSYKDVNRVVEISDRVGLTQMVCRLKPCLVIKG